jgi:hypothetical protein
MSWAVETRKVAGIIIDDGWQTCSLVSIFGAENKNMGWYQVKNVDPINQILKRGRLRRVLQRRRL